MKIAQFALALALSIGPFSVTFAQAQKKSYTIGLVAKSQSNPVFQAARVGAMDAARDLGKKHGIEIKIDWRTPNEEDAQKQPEAIEQLALPEAHGITLSGPGPTQRT